MDTVHVTERITAASLCISRNGKPLSRFFFQRSARHSNVISLRFEFFRVVWIVVNYVDLSKFIVVAIETKNFKEMNVILDLLKEYM